MSCLHAHSARTVAVNDVRRGSNVSVETHPAVLLLNAGSLATGYAIIIQAGRSNGLIGCGVAR